MWTEVGDDVHGLVQQTVQSVNLLSNGWECNGLYNFITTAGCVLCVSPSVTVAVFSAAMTLRIQYA